MSATPPTTLLQPRDAELLRRLHAEWSLARCQVETAQLREAMAQNAFEQAVREICQNQGIVAPVNLDLARGVFTHTEE